MSQMIARLPLDFRALQSVPVGTMVDPQTLEAALKLHLNEMRERLEKAASIARAAQACADAGNLDKAIEIALDAEQLIYEVNTFLNAASMMHRMDKS